MIQDRLKSARLIALFFAGLVVFNYPLLSLFNNDTTVIGIPLLFLFIFSAWCLIIGLIAMTTDTRRDSLSDDQTVYKD